LYLKKLNLIRKKKIFIDAISSLRQSMERHENSVIMGQAYEYGGF
jgi:hypothetical protein